MAVAYLLLAVAVIIINHEVLPDVVSMIFREAFTGTAVLGGGIGGALMMGIKRGLFSNEAGVLGSAFVAIAVFFFAYTSIIANYYHGETNIQFIMGKKWPVTAYRLLVGAMVMMGAITSLNIVCALADVFMGLMTLCNLAAIIMLGKYAKILLKDYTAQRKAGKDPTYHRTTIPEISTKTECRPE